MMKYFLLLFFATSAIAATVSVKDLSLDQFLKVNADGSINSRIQDASSNFVTTQANGSQRALDAGIDVAGVQIDPREYFTYTKSKAGQMFSASTGTQAITGTTEVPLLYFNNPNASGKSVVFYSFSFGPTLGNNYVTYRLYKDPTVTANGTPVAIIGARNTGQAASVVNIYTAPTVTAHGTNFSTKINSGLTGQSIDTIYNFRFWIEPGHSVLITRQLSSNATIGGVNIVWMEE